MDQIVDQTDLTDAKTFLSGVPHDYFTALRRDDPVHWHKEADGPGFWCITKYDDITALSRDPKRFSSAAENGGHRIFDEVDRRDMGLDEPGVSMISQDPPLHTSVRKTMLPTMRAGYLHSMEDKIRARTRRLFDGMAGQENVDWVEAIAAPLPIETLADLMDIDDEHHAKLFEWSNAIIAEADPEMRPSPEYMEQTWLEMAQFAGGLYGERVGKDGTDILSLLMNMPVNGQPISVKDYLANFGLLIVGGNETTRNSITGSIMAFTEFPDQRQLLIDQPELIPSAVAEIIRWVTPVLHMRRTAMEDVELRGKTISKGDKVLLWYVSGNRDEDIFDDPFTFDITRMHKFGNRVMHLGFGKGEHMCLGRKLAEMQLHIYLEELLKTYPKAVQTAEPRRVESNFVTGFKDLPVRLQGAAEG